MGRELVFLALDLTGYEWFATCLSLDARSMMTVLSRWESLQVCIWSFTHYYVERNAYFANRGGIGYIWLLVLFVADSKLVDSSYITFH